MTLADLVLNKEGFNRLLFDDLEPILEAKAKQLMGEDIDLGDESPLGQWIDLLVYDGVEFLELLQKLYLSGSVETASDDALDIKVKDIGITRLKASKSRVTLLFTGDAGTTIPTGTLVETQDGFQFITDKSITLSGTTGTVTATAVNAGGAGNVPIDSVTVISTPQAGVTAVTNVAMGEGGANKETDVALRSRYYSSLSRNGSTTADSIRAELLVLPGVRAVRVRENDTEAEVNGIPKKSFATYVLGGEDQEIADAIMRKKALGIRAFGTTVMTSVDHGKNLYKIGFSRPDSIPVTIEVTVKTNATFAPGGAEDIKDKIISYIGGTDTKGNFYQGLGMGDDVVSYMVILASGVPGVEDVSVRMKKGDGQFVNTNIEIEDNEVATTSIEDVTINVQQSS